jgi:hypothetical protein
MNPIDIHSRLGIYWVGENRFFNKFDALIYASSHSHLPIRWDFNDVVFSSIDWKIPIETSLIELYKIRAKQLRDRYDFLSLNFSGGADSTNILHAFIDNDIFLDEIVMYRPKKVTPNFVDTSSSNIWAEIDYAAIPHLKKYLSNNKTVVRLLDINEFTELFFSNEKLYDQYKNHYAITPFAVARTAMDLLDRTWNLVQDSGKTVCHIHGFEKPSIRIDNGDYVFSFHDVGLMRPQLNDDKESFLTQKFHEYFYWTPDLPQIVIKQCQEIKLASNYDPILRHTLLGKITPENQSLLVPYIYPEHSNSIRNLFVTKKPTSSLLAPFHDWFYTAHHNKDKGIMNDIANYVRGSIADKFFEPNKPWLPTNEPLTPAQKLYITPFGSRRYIL